jgi:hypothetical protein
LLRVDGTILRRWRGEIVESEKTVAGIAYRRMKEEEGREK